MSTITHSGSETPEPPYCNAAGMRRIADLEAEVRDLRQRLIGGVEGVKAGRDLSRWATSNDAWLRETGPNIANYHNPEH